MLYGDQAITFSTLKAEVSHLRAALGGQLGSRPYRLLMPVATDVEHVLGLLRRGEVARRRRRLRRRPAARHQLARRSPSSPSTSRSRSARRCSPTRSRTPWSATASSRRTTPRCSRSAWPPWSASAAARTPPYRCSRAGSRSLALSGCGAPGDARHGGRRAVLPDRRVTTQRAVASLTALESSSSARTLIEQEPVSGADAAHVGGHLQRLCRAAAAAVPASGVGVSVMSDAGPQLTVASSPLHAEVEELQFTLGEGPCLAARASGAPVLTADLGRRCRTPLAGLRPGRARAGDPRRLRLPAPGRRGATRRPRRLPAPRGAAAPSRRCRWRSSSPRSRC